MTHADIPAFILAAGRGSRLGQNKPLALWTATQTLLELACNSCVDAGFKDITVILGCESERILDVIPSRVSRLIKFVVNSDWQSGMSSSIKVCVDLAEADGASGIFLFACDLPRVRPTDILALKEAWKGSDNIVASRYDQTFGIPIIFGSKWFEQLKALSGDKGAKSIVQSNMEHATLCEMPNAAYDVDCPNDLPMLS